MVVVTVNSFDIGCRLIVLHDQVRELRQAGMDADAARYAAAIGHVAREWDEARARDLAVRGRRAA